MSTGPDATPPIPAGSRYVAMGSSFAAGPGLTPRAPGSPRRAGRSAGNYAHLVARALGLDLHDVTYSGATTSDILTSSAAGQPAQLDAVTPDTRLVTITAGGNDVGFLPRLTLASLPWPLRALPRVRARVAGFGDPDATDERFTQLQGNLATIGRGRAVADIKQIRLGGFIAWITWLTVHLWYLIGFENRLLILTRWAFSFLVHGRGARLITDTTQRPTSGTSPPVASLPQGAPGGSLPVR